MQGEGDTQAQTSVAAGTGSVAFQLLIVVVMVVSRTSGPGRGVLFTWHTQHSHITRGMNTLT